MSTKTAKAKSGVNRVTEIHTQIYTGNLLLDAMPSREQVDQYEAMMRAALKKAFPRVKQGAIYIQRVEMSGGLVQREVYGKPENGNPYLADEAALCDLIFQVEQDVYGQWIHQISLEALASRPPTPSPSWGQRCRATCEIKAVEFGSLKAMVAVTLAGMTIRGFKVIETNGEQWVEMPSREIKKDGKSEYWNIVKFEDAADRAAFSEWIRNEYQRATAR